MQDYHRDIITSPWANWDEELDIFITSDSGGIFFSCKREMMKVFYSGVLLRSSHRGEMSHVI